MRLEGRRGLSGLEGGLIVAFLQIIGILLIPVVWGLASARLIEWIRDRRIGHGTGGEG